MRGLIIKLALLGVAGLFSIGWLAVQIGQLGGPAGQFAKTYKVTAAFSDATGIVSGDEVRMAGVRIGKVGAVSVERGKAQVALNIDKHFDLPRTSRFELRWRNLLGQRFVQVVPSDDAKPGGPALAAGARVGTDRTGAAADLSYLLNHSEPLLAKLDTEGVNRVMATLASSLEGRESTMGEAIDQSAQLVSTLSARAGTIGSSITQMADLLDTIAGHDDEVRQLLGSMGSVSQAIAGKSADLGRAVGSAGEFTGVLARVLESGGAELDTSLKKAQSITAVLAKNQQQLGEGVRTLNWTPAALIRASNAGNWLNIYGRGFGFINTFQPEPRIGPDYSDAGPDDTRGPAPLLGQPRVPTPAVPETDAGPVVINPSPDHPRSSGTGLQQLLAPLKANPS